MACTFCLINYCTFHLLLQMTFYATLVCVLQLVAALPMYTPAMDGWRKDRDNLIMEYFLEGLSNSEIIGMLLSMHSITLSLAQLKRILRRLQLKRRVQCDPRVLEEMLAVIQQELRGSGRCLGYKAMWKRLKLLGICVPRKSVRYALLVLDPNGVNLRKKKRLRRRNYVNPGPNFCWHVDGNDKSKPFGFAIHAAIDGFSRKIMWLEVGRSNNNPTIITSYYLESVRVHKCVPCVMRCDMGTENAHLSYLQPYFTRNSDGPFAGDNSFVYGKSTSNQRIEAWWSILRKQCLDFWISLFKDMRDSGLLHTHNEQHLNSLRFSFLDLLRHDLERMVLEWNQHCIDAKPNAEGPRGKPNVLYYLPESKGTHDYGVHVDIEEVEQYMFNLDNRGFIPNDHDEEFVQYVNTVLPNWQEPRNVQDAIQLFVDVTRALAWSRYFSPTSWSHKVLAVWY